MKINRRRQKISACVIISPLRIVYPPGSGHPKKVQKHFSEKFHSAEKESINPTPYLYTLQKPIAYTNSLPNITPHLITFPNTLGFAEN